MLDSSGSLNEIYSIETASTLVNRTLQTLVSSVHYSVSLVLMFGKVHHLPCVL